jgi:hypothetical protein
MAEALATGSALYYPYIHIRSLDHVKASLIYWDRVRRIVPDMMRGGPDRKYAFDDSYDAQLLADHGLLVCTDPVPYENQAADKFFEHIAPQAANFRIDLDAGRELARSKRGIHIEKIGFEFLGRLQQMGLAYKFGDWVSMHDEVGAFYMFCLASEMGQKMNAALMGDSSEDAALGQSLLFEPSSPAEVSEHLLNVGISLPTPEALHDVPIKKVADFAQRRAGERLRFRQEVEGIIESARSSSDPNQIADYLSTRKTEIAEAVDAMRKTQDELLTGGVVGVAKITVPTSFAGAGAIAHVSPVGAAMLAAAGIAVMAIACFAETRGKLRQAKLFSPYHYLISVENDLGPRVI